MVNFMVRNFVRGLLLVVPGFVTAWVVFLVFRTMDRWFDLEPLLDRRIPGAGIVLTILAITLIGALASTVATRWFFAVVDRVFRRLPLVKLLYTSLRDLIGAFVGDERRFDRPVRVRLGTAGEVQVFGFLTRDDLADVGLPGHAAVYLPQSYNFAGNLIAVPCERVSPLELDAVHAMAFVVSAGVAGKP